MCQTPGPASTFTRSLLSHICRIPVNTVQELWARGLCVNRPPTRPSIDSRREAVLVLSVDQNGDAATVVIEWVAPQRIT